MAYRLKILCNFAMVFSFSTRFFFLSCILVQRSPHKQLHINIILHIFVDFVIRLLFFMREQWFRLSLFDAKANEYFYLDFMLKRIER